MYYVLFNLYVAAILVPSTSAGFVRRGVRYLSLFDLSTLHEKQSAEQTPISRSENEDVNVPSQSKETRIIGGSETTRSRFPYAVSLEDEIGHFCGGSLIAPDMVLTAAHCQGGSYNVVIGRHNLDTNDGESIPVKKEMPHPKYDDYSTDSDWMVLLLTRPTTLDIPFIKLNSEGSNPKVGEDVTVMGWGDTVADDSIQELSHVLMSVDVTVISNDDCSDSSGKVGKYSETYKGDITQNMLCARDNNQDSCQGDSGGPLVIQGNDASGDIQVGVVSWGIGCASSDFPGVYSRVSQGYNWIKDQVCSQSSKPPADLCAGASSPGDTSPTTPVHNGENNHSHDNSIHSDDGYNYTDDFGYMDDDHSPSSTSPTYAPTEWIGNGDDDFSPGTDDQAPVATPTSSSFLTYSPSVLDSPHDDDDFTPGTDDQAPVATPTSSSFPTYMPTVLDSPHEDDDFMPGTDDQAPVPTPTSSSVPTNKPNEVFFDDNIPPTVFTAFNIPSTPGATNGANSNELYPTFSPTASPSLAVDSMGASTAFATSGGIEKDWVTIMEEDFINDYGLFNQGSNDTKWFDSKKNRNGVINLQDYDSSIYSNSITDTSYTTFRVIFSVFILNLESDDSFCFDISLNGGSDWTEQKCWKAPDDFKLKSWYDDVTLNFQAANASNLAFRFRCVGDDNQDDVFIDKVTLQGS